MLTFRAHRADLRYSPSHNHITLSVHVSWLPHLPLSNCTVQNRLISTIEEPGDLSGVGRCSQSTTMEAVQTGICLIRQVVNTGIKFQSNAWLVIYHQLYNLAHCLNQIISLVPMSVGFDSFRCIS